MDDVFGTVDAFQEPRLIVGWVTNAARDTTRKVTVTAFFDDERIGRAVADVPRPDLVHIGDGAIAYYVECSRDLTMQDFIDGRVRIQATDPDDRVLGPIGLGDAFRRRMAALEIQRSIAAMRSAAGLAGPDHLDAAIRAAAAMTDETARHYRAAMDALCTAAEAPAPLPDPEAAAILRRFESLGANCEFGLVQRHYGVEQSGLLRWGASWGGLAGVIAGLDARFANAGDQVSIAVFGPEYISRDDTYNIVFHTDRLVGAVDETVLRRNETVRIGYLARNLIENIEDASKIFVYRDAPEPGLDAMLELLQSIRSIGPAKLFWVSLATDPSRVGQVEEIHPNLLRGYIDRFSPPENIHADCSYAVWLDLCRAALAHAAAPPCTLAPCTPSPCTPAP